jgi:hypothetical protein
MVAVTEGLAIPLESYFVTDLPDDLIEDCPALLHAAVLWAGRVLDLTESASLPAAQQGGLSPEASTSFGDNGSAVLRGLSHGGDNSVAYVSNTHLYVTLVGGSVKRCIPLKTLRKILLKAVPPITRPPVAAAAPTTRGTSPPPPAQQPIVIPARTYLLFICKEPEYDLLAMAPSGDDAKNFMQAIARALKTWDASARPLLGTFDTPKNEQARLSRPPNYQCDPIQLPKRPDAPPYHARLRRFYERYMPEKVKDVDRNLVAFRNREEEMFRKLVEKYGPEPDRPVVSAAVGDGRDAADMFSGPGDANDTFAARITRFYKQYNPDKLHTIAGTLEAYKGNEVALFKRLVEQYGPEPPVKPSATTTIAVPLAAAHGQRASSAAGFRLRILRLLDSREVTRHTPLSQVDQDLNRNKGREQAYLTELVERYGAEPDYDAARVKQRLTAMYAQHCPHKLGNVDAMLLKYEGREEYMMTLLVRKYGPEPPLAEAQQAASAQLAERLRAFYELHDPSKIDTIPRLLAKFAGSEEELFRRLRDKYGENSTHPDPLLERDLFSTPAAVIALPHTGLGSAGDGLPYVDIPPPQRPLFPSLTNGKVLYFNRAGHFAPPMATTLRYVFLSPTHLYIADDEHNVHRCVSLRTIRRLVGTFNRADHAANCVVLVQCQPQEHDAMLSFPNDVQGKRFVWFVLEIIGQYHFGHIVESQGVSSFKESGIEPVLESPAWYVCPLVPVPRRDEVPPAAVDVDPDDSAGVSPIPPLRRNNNLFGTASTKATPKNETPRFSVPSFAEVEPEKAAVAALQVTADAPVTAAEGRPRLTQSSPLNLYESKAPFGGSRSFAHGTKPSAPSFETIDLKPRDVFDFDRSDTAAAPGHASPIQLGRFAQDTPVSIDRRLTMYDDDDADLFVDHAPRYGSSVYETSPTTIAPAVANTADLHRRQNVTRLPLDG